MAENPENVIPFPSHTLEDTGGPPPDDLRLAALEACLFANPSVLTVPQLAQALRLREEDVLEDLGLLQEQLVRNRSGIRLVAVGEGWQLRTEARLASYVAAIRGARPFKLTRAALETLSVIAYRQPISKGVIDEIRGVDCGGVLRMLLERGLVTSVGRTDEPGRAITYGTTSQFLHTFGMRNLQELPPLREIRDLVRDDARESPVIPFELPE